MRTYKNCSRCKIALDPDVQNVGCCYCYSCRTILDCESRIKNPRGYLLTSVKNRARRDGIEFSLTVEDIPDIPMYCPVLGIELKFEVGSYNCSPSVDRIDNYRGYVPGNVRIISYRANTLKTNATFNEIEKLYEDAIHLRGEILCQV